MKKLLSVLTPLTLMSVASVAPANAVVIGGWNSFDASAATFPVAADTNDSNSIAELDTQNLSPIGFGDTTFALSSWNTGSSVDLNQYIEFWLVPAPGFEFDFTNLQLYASDELQWNKSFEKSQNQLVAAARLAKQQIAQGLAQPMDYEQL